jgi:hypothetical protein
MDQVSLPIPPIEAIHRSATEFPFVVVLEQLDRKANGTFRPGAFLKVTPTLRTAGLLRALPAEDLKSLLFLLSFLTPNGECQPSVLELSEAMGVSEGAAKLRMQRLEGFLWRGKPILLRLERETGLAAFTLAPGVISTYEQMPESDHTQPGLQQTGNREAVIAYSRDTYATPRAEVERQIALQMGWEEREEPATPEEAEKALIRRRLLAIGVEKEKATDLLLRFDIDQIRRQLSWLPYRQAKSPARYLVAAIEGDYQAPSALRQHQGEVAKGQNDGADKDGQPSQASDPLGKSA